MKNVAMALLVASSVMISACDSTWHGGTPAGSSPGDLATAPLGGMYYGQAKLKADSCNEPEPGSSDFDPFALNVELHPENSEQTKLLMVAGQVKIEHLAPTKESDYHFNINQEVLLEAGYIYTFKLNGTINLGEMNLDFYESLHLGETVEDPGDVFCDASYKLHMIKVVNYPYVSAPETILVPEGRTLPLLLPQTIQ